jgi:hypothetical protein
MKWFLLLLLLLSPLPPHGAAIIAKKWTQNAGKLVLHPVILGNQIKDAHKEEM